MADIAVCREEPRGNRSSSSPSSPPRSLAPSGADSTSAVPSPVDEPAGADEEDIPPAVLFQRPPSPDVEEIPWVRVSIFLILCITS